MIKFILSLLLILGSASLLLGQDSKHILLLPFDGDKYKQLNKQDHRTIEDSVWHQPILPIDKEHQLTKEDSDAHHDDVMVYRDGEYAMKLFKLNEAEMAKMPKMNISNDIHFTMRIKKIDSPFDKIKQQKSDMLHHRELPKSLIEP